MYTLELDYPIRPELVMPEPLQTWLLSISIAATLGCLVYTAMVGKKHHSLLPVLFVIAGFTSSGLEAIATNLGHAVHAQIGQITLYEAVDRAIPWHLALIYAIFFGLAYTLIYVRYISNTLTSGFVWKVFFGAMVLNYLGEIIPVSYGVWAYYEPQALWVWKGTHPLFWTFLNAGCAIFAMVLILHLLPKLTGWRQILVLVISPIGAVMGHIGAGFPFYLAANSTWGNAAVQFSGVLSVIFCLYMVKFSAEYMVERQAVYKSDAKPELPVD